MFLHNLNRFFFTSRQLLQTRGSSRDLVFYLAQTIHLTIRWIFSGAMPAAEIRNNLPVKRNRITLQGNHFTYNYHRKRIETLQRGVRGHWSPQVRGERPQPARRDVLLVLKSAQSKRYLPVGDQILSRGLISSTIASDLNRHISTPICLKQDSSFKVNLIFYCTNKSHFFLLNSRDTDDTLDDFRTGPPWLLTVHNSRFSGLLA